MNPKEKRGVSNGLRKRKCLFSSLTSPLREACGSSSRSHVIEHITARLVWLYIQFNNRICIKSKKKRKKYIQIFSDLSFLGPDLFYSRLLTFSTVRR